MQRLPRGVYTKEFREQAVRLVLEEGLPILQAGQRLSMSAKTLANWVWAARRGELASVGGGQKPLLDSEQELRRLRRDLAQMTMERDLLKKAAAYLCQGVAARYALMATLRHRFPQRVMCPVFQVSPSGFYAWQQRPPSARSCQEGRLRAQIQAAHERTRQTYGPERLQRDLAAHGVRVGVHRIKRIRRQLGLRCRQKRRYRATTDSRHTLPVAANVLEQSFEVQRPNQAWLSDITYIPTHEGWLYLAGIKDLHSGRIVGYAMADHLRQSLVMQALDQALYTRRPKPGLICHPDRGSQYCADDYQQRLRRHGLQPSMSRRGNCYDNAPMESFWGTLKTELVHQHRFETRQQAITQITAYIELFYNRQRLQARLDYLSPAAFEQRFYQSQLSKT